MSTDIKELIPIKKKYNSKKYNDTFRLKHADKLKTKIKCSICNHDYTYYTKSKHMKTKKHQRVVDASTGHLLTQT